MQFENSLALGTGSSITVQRCQICGSDQLRQVVFLGYLPPVNQMRPIGEIPGEQPSYPALLLHCEVCDLVQLGLIVDPRILFPPSYPYTSGTTRILRENFAELARECADILHLEPEDLIVDIGSNDGTLLSNFAGSNRVHGVEPSNIGLLARQAGIPTDIEFFGPDSAARIRNEVGLARVVTATNVFAHMEDIHRILESIVTLLGERGVFVSESHYLYSLVEGLQYDTIYHEHLRHYSLTSLSYLLRMHGLDVIHAKRIATHGGSIRVYAARPGAYDPLPSVEALLGYENAQSLDAHRLAEFRRDVVLSKLQLHSLLLDVRTNRQRVYGIGAPSRASTLINYVGLDDGILDYVLEVPGSQKLGKYIPGTLIPVVDESRLFQDQPEYALLLSWHIADELIPKLRGRGFKGDFIVPLPAPRIIRSED